MLTVAAPEQIHPAETDAVLTNVLETLSLVDSPPEEEFDVFTRAISRLMEVPVTLISFVQEDRDRQYFKSQVGLTGAWAEARQTPLSHSFCQYVKRDNRPLIIEDAPNHTLVCDNLAIRDLNVVAYLGVPVHSPRGSALGALCAIDSQRRVWRANQVEAMTNLAYAVSTQIRFRNALCRAHGLAA